MKISLVDKVPETVPVWNGRPVYLIVYTYGIATPLNFQFDVEVPKNWNGNSTVEIAVVGRYVQKNVIRMPLYQKFLDQFPEWADVQAWLGAFESWIV